MFRAYGRLRDAAYPLGTAVRSEVIKNSGAKMVLELKADSHPTRESEDQDG